MMETTLGYVDSKDFRSLPESVLLADPELQPPKEKAPAGTPPYLAALYDYPLLTREQEFQWFRKMNYLRFLAAKAQRKLTLSRLNAARLKRVESLVQQADEIRNRIVQCNLRLVVSIAKSLVDYANSLDDLISEGNLPLIRAVEIFDFTRGLRFSTYATWAVRNGLFRVSTRNRKQRQRFWASDPERFEQHGPKSAPIDEDRLTAEERTQLLKLVGRLDPRSRTIVRERFGLTSRDQKPARFHELADKLCLSTERVRQLLARALDNLRNLSESSSPQQAG
jgi:RNA polymerase primary sigma factor/RNA polymerase sigma factor